MAKTNKKDIFDVCNDMEDIKNEIKFFEELRWQEGDEYFPNTAPHPFQGVEEEDFEKIRDKVVIMLKECYNKKNNQMIKMCNKSKYE